MEGEYEIPITVTVRGGRVGKTPGRCAKDAGLRVCCEASLWRMLRLEEMRGIFQVRNGSIYHRHDQTCVEVVQRGTLFYGCCLW